MKNFKSTLCCFLLGVIILSLTTDAHSQRDPVTGDVNIGADVVRPRNLFYGSDPDALTQWFAANGKKDFVLWNRETWKPILDESNTQQVPESTFREEQQALRGSALFSMPVITSGVNRVQHLAIPSEVTLRSKDGRELIGIVRVFGYVQWRNIVKRRKEISAQPLFSVADIKGVKQDIANPQDHLKSADLLSVPKYVLNWSAIEKFPEVNLAPFSSVPLWIEWQSLEAQAGLYEGDIVIGHQSVKFRINIEEPALNEHDVPLGLVYYYNNSSPRLSYLDDMYRHGSRISFAVGNKGEEEKNPIAQALQTGHQVMINSGGFWGSGVNRKWLPISDARKLLEEDPENFKLNIISATENLTQQMEEVGIHYNQWMVEIWDEPSDSTADIWVEVAKLIKETNPKVRIIANPGSDWTKHRTTLEGTFKKLAPYTDIWWPFVQHLIADNGEHLRYLKTQGKPIGFYGTPGGFIGQSELAVHGFFRQAGWVTYHHQLQGMGFWSVDFPNASPWTHQNVKGDYAKVFYRGPNGPIPSRNWESYRRGVEEYQMAVLLERMLNASPDAYATQAEDIKVELRQRAARLAYGKDFKGPVPLGDDITEQASYAASGIQLGAVDSERNFEESRQWLIEQILDWNKKLRE